MQSKKTVIQLANRSSTHFARELQWLADQLLNQPSWTQADAEIHAALKLAATWFAETSREEIDDPHQLSLRWEPGLIILNLLARQAEDTSLGRSLRILLQQANRWPELIELIEP